MKRKMTILFGALVLAGTLGPAVTPVQAADYTTRIWYFEDNNYNGDTNVRYFAQGSLPDLRNVSQGLSGGCNKNGYTTNNWNDCISSFVVYVKAGKCFRIMKDTWYAGATIAIVKRAPGLSTYTAYYGNLGSYNDTASSIEWGTTTDGSTCYWRA